MACKYIIRCLIICFWVLLILLFLSAPRIAQLFTTHDAISILAWPKDLDPKILSQFERETGIKVHVSYFEDYEELLVKLRTGKGQGYDLITPADYVMPLLIQDGLVKKIDRSKLNFWQDLLPSLLAKPFDPKNDYAIPYFWGIYGIGYDRDYFGNQQPRASWSLIFGDEYPSIKIGMLDDAREISLVAAQYLFKSIDNLDEKKFARIKKLLLGQKNKVAMFTDTRANFLLASKTCPVVLTISYEVAQVMCLFPHVDFMIPEEGSFILIDLFAIPMASAKDELVYTFLNYVYKPDKLRQFLSLSMGFSPIQGITATPDTCLRPVPIPSEEQVAKASFFQDEIDEKDLNDLWLALKA